MYKPLQNECCIKETKFSISTIIAENDIKINSDYIENSKNEIMKCQSCIMIRGVD